MTKTCPHAASGCDYPASECAGRCASKQQPEALRLADAIERYNAGVHSQAIVEDYSKAAAELRRLHDQKIELLRARQVLGAENIFLKYSRDILLNAVLDVADSVIVPELMTHEGTIEVLLRLQKSARAAIAKAGGAA